ncbi:MAG TPA: hypothetical protein VN428_24585 [Bryobacteraceae bacterium]|nr:hypothetical protein [Bryobacteraceae bacterium]
MSATVFAQTPEWTKDTAAKVEATLVAKHGEQQRERIRRGLRQTSQFWRAEDGDSAAFSEFATAHFQADPSELLARCERLFEQYSGHMLEITREFREHTDLDRGPIRPFDEIFAAYDPSAHANEDFFRNKLAFAVLLNFPLTTLDERIKNGERWSRNEWAEARLAQWFSKRVPAEVNLVVAAAGAEAERYIAQYNIWMHHVLDDSGKRLFPEKMRLLAHWNLRDQIKADYSEKDGLARQRVIARVMDHIVNQTIPRAVIDNPSVDWNPFTGSVRPTDVKDYDSAPLVEPSAAPEPDTRYATLLLTFQALRKIDPYSPTAPTHIARKFDEERELPEERVRKMLTDVVSSPLVPKVAALIEKRLGRKLEAFDIWYAGFKPRGKYTEAQLDAITRKKYPTPSAYKDDMPRMLEALAFSPDRAKYLAANIVVDPARGSGHAWGAQLRSEPAHLRTRVGNDGMDFKGYNIAVHEMGHNVEQTFSLKNIDHWLLNGVPNTAFTEAVAFVFQAQDLALLGLAEPDPQAEALRTLNDFWGTYEIAGVGLVDMAVWHWMYDHPNAKPAELKQAVLRISKDVWNKYYAPAFGARDVALLGIYSHMIERYLYLPDYSIGHLIAHQLEEHIRKAGKIGPEVERITRQGRLTPDLWMKGATGAPVGAEAMLAATERALAGLPK